MTRSSLSLAAGLDRSYVGVMLFNPTRLDMGSSTAEGLAWAANVSKNWLQTGRGSPHDPDVPADPPPQKPKAPRYARFGDYPDWQDNVDVAVDKKLLEKDAKLIAGADLRVQSGYRPAHLSPETVRAVCLYAWHLSSDNRKGAYSDAWQAELLRPPAQRAAVARRPKTLVGRERESGAK